MTQRRQIGVAVVGSGRIGTLRAHMAARHPSVRFLAVSDKDPERAGTLGRAVGAQLASGNNLDVIAHPEVDAVIVAVVLALSPAVPRCAGGRRISPLPPRSARS